MSNSTDSSSNHTSTPSWTAYATAAGAALAAPGVADAAIVQIPAFALGISPSSISSTNFPLDIDGDSVGDITLRASFFNFYVSASSYGYSQWAAIDAPFGILPKTASQNFSVASITTSGTVSNAGYRSTVSASYINYANGLPTDATATFGVALSGGGSAWISVLLSTQSPNAYDTLAILAGAYETEAGTPIHVGSVPEPSTLGFLATGALAVTALRRRPRKSREES